MEKIEIRTDDFDLERTLTCGQTFCWNRTKGDLYGQGEDVFYSFRNGKPLIVKQEEGKVIAETELERSEVEKALGLDHSLAEVFESFPEDQKIDEARRSFQGLRVLQDEFFPCTISYIMSSQMRIPRIKKMFNQIAERHGEKMYVNGFELLRFPGREEMSDVTEEELRDIGVGYRAPYIIKTLDRMEDMPEEDQLRQMDYGEAKEQLKKLHGVGDKVADCILLFSLGFHEATPLDTWAKKAVEKHYPEIHSDKYQETSKNLRDRFGPKAGYATEYLFHAARQGELET